MHTTTLPESLGVPDVGCPACRDVVNHAYTRGNLLDLLDVVSGYGRGHLWVGFAGVTPICNTHWSGDTA